MEGFVWEHADGATAITESVAATVRSRGYSGPLTVVPLAIDVQRFAQAQRDESLSSRLGLKANVVGFLGRLVPEKGIRDLMAAFHSLTPELRARTTLLVIGDGPLATEVDGARGVVRVAPSHSDVQRYLALVDCLVLASRSTPNWREQLGRAAIEAMAAGKPVIGSNSGEIPQVVSHGRTGLIVPEGDVHALASAIEYLLQNPSARLSFGRQGRIDSAAYDPERVASRLLTVLRRGTSTAT
jgi:glycosyltransferase involved in cell wall biosynthesis